MCWEELRALEGFRGTVDRNEMAQGKLVGEYDMPTGAPMEPCGIQQCKTPHRGGYIVELVDESVSHIGKHCGKKHFAEVWRAKLKNYRQAADAEAKAIALVQIRERAKALLEKDPDEPNGLRLVREMLAAFDALPQQIRDSLVANAQDGISQITRARPPTSKEVQDAKFHGQPMQKHVNEVLGELSGLKAILPSLRADRMWDQAVPRALAKIDRALPGSADEIATSFGNYEKVLSDLDQSIQRAFAFFSEENLAKLRLMQATSRLGINRVVVSTTPFTITCSSES